MSPRPKFATLVAVAAVVIACCCRVTDCFRRARQAEFLKELDWYTITQPSLVTPTGDFLSHTVHSTRDLRPTGEAADRASRAAEVTGGRIISKRSAAAFGDRGHGIERGVPATPEPLAQAAAATTAAEQEGTKLYIRVLLGSLEYTLELWPNLHLVSPSVIVERRGGSSGSSKLNPTDNRRQPAAAMCHYVGRVRGIPASTAAISTCGGLTGMIALNGSHYFIEPMEWRDFDDATAGASAQRHVIYKVPPSVLAATVDAGERQQRRLHKRGYPTATAHPACGVSDDNYPRGSDRRRPDGRTRVTVPSRRKRSTSVERFVEALVVVDPMMMAYYKDEDIETYVFTIMNMVSEMYHYASIGNAINIVVVRLMLLETDEPDLVITHHADNTLNSFCKWQQTINPEKTSPEHHDVAILLTRRNICSKMNEPCSTLGLAQVMGMCQLHRSCNVNEDTGLALAYTVAHELGHNFGMKHDGSGSECPLPTNDKVFIMAPEMVTQAGSLLLWSSCSRDAITRFLDRGWGDCLLDEPGGRTRPDYPITPPGVMYDADHQCRLQYGSGTRHCYGIEDVCSTLWCRVNNHCVTRLEPAAEGTLCDADNGTVNGVVVPKKWCFAGKCTAIGERPTAIDGGWAAWSSWSECTRTCGGGVSSAERHCDNPMPSNGGRYCTGERRRYRICNTQSCPEGAATFREVQCSEHNSQLYRGTLYEWEPVSTPDNPCQLVCKPTTMYFSVTLREVVRDGTPCRTGTKNMCLSGICRAVGCDWIIDSDAKEDRCGVCHGDGSTCKTIKDQFKAQEGMGYVEAAIIPEGARNIRVEEVAEANNYLAIRSERGDYYLNGHWFIQWSGDYAAAGTVIHYERNGNKEGITAVGPLREPIHVMLLFQSHNPGVLFEYTVPNENATRRLSFAWKYLDWSHCTVSCGGGLQRSKVVCSEQEAGIVEDIFCKNATKPDDKARTCNVHLCPARWWTGPWQHCSATCGSTGTRRRTVLCVRSLGPDEQMALDDADCDPLPRPQADEPCSRHLPPCPTVTTTAATTAAAIASSAPIEVRGDGIQLWLPPARGMQAASAWQPGIQCSDLCEKQPSAEARACHRENGLCLDVASGDADPKRCLNVTCGEWRIVGWTECPCGGGEQRSLDSCVGGNVCSLQSRPASRSRFCDRGPCEAEPGQPPETVTIASSSRAAVESGSTAADHGVAELPASPAPSASTGPSLAAATTAAVSVAAADITLQGPWGNAQLGPDGWRGRDAVTAATSVSSSPPVGQGRAEPVAAGLPSASLDVDSVGVDRAVAIPDGDGMVGSRPSAAATARPSDTDFNSGDVVDSHDDEGEETGRAQPTPSDERQAMAADRGVDDAADQKPLDAARVATAGTRLAAAAGEDLEPPTGDDSPEPGVPIEGGSRRPGSSKGAAFFVSSATADPFATGDGGTYAAEEHEKLPRQGGGHWPPASASAAGIPEAAAADPAFPAGEHADAVLPRPLPMSASAESERLDAVPASPVTTATVQPPQERWRTSDWSRCSATCGRGWQTRSVWCAGQHEWTSTEPTFASCGQEPQPEGRRPCHVNCIEWVSGPWSQCSATCGGGEQIRNVQCINRQTDQTSDECDHALKPTESQPCAADKCSPSSAALQEWSGSDCTSNKLASSTCEHLKERGYCLFTYVVKNCCISCSGMVAAVAGVASGGRSDVSIGSSSR